MTIGARIKKTRKEKHISQKELGEKLGVSAAMIGQYETGVRNPKIETIQKIADALEVPVTDLLFPPIDPNDPEDQKAFGRYIKDGKVELPKLINGEAAEREFYQSDILPAEFNEFSKFIDKLGYRISLDENQYYLARVNGNERKKITVDELKTLVRASKAAVTGLLDDMMNRE